MNYLHPAPRHRAAAGQPAARRQPRSRTASAARMTDARAPRAGHRLARVASSTTSRASSARRSSCRAFALRRRPQPVRRTTSRCTRARTPPACARPCSSAASRCTWKGRRRRRSEVRATRRHVLASVPRGAACRNRSHPRRARPRRAVGRPFDPRQRAAVPVRRTAARPQPRHVRRRQLLAGTAGTDSKRCSSAQDEYDFVVNGRFKGGYITRHYGEPARGIDAVQLEISQRNYMDEDSFAYDAAKAGHLRKVISACCRPR